MRALTDRKSIVGALLACLLLPAACGEPQQVRQSGVMGGNGQVGDILLRSVHVEAPPEPQYPPGADARLWLTLINSGDRADILVDASTAAATAVEIRWDDDCDGTFDTVPGLALAPAEPAATDPSRAAVPADAYHLRLVGMTREVLAGTTIDVTFHFQYAGEVTMAALVQPSDAPRPEPSSRCAP